MLPVAIGAFHDQQIKLPILFIKCQGRVFYDRFIEPADITCKTYGIVAAVITRPDDAERRTEDVAGIVKRTGHLVSDGYRMTVWIAVKAGQGLLCILGSIQGRDTFQMKAVDQFINSIDIKLMFVFLQRLYPLFALFFGSFHFPEGRAYHLVVQVLSVRLLDMGGIGKEIFTGGSGCPGAHNTAGKIVSG